MATVIITGGTGMTGKALTKALQRRGYTIIILTRDVKDSVVKKDNPDIEFAGWNIEKGYLDEKAISKADYIIHLAGASLAKKRWSQKRKQEIFNSRVAGSKLIVESLKRIPNKVKAVISASAIGWYHSGSGDEDQLKETDPPATDFLGTVCRQWESAIETVKGSGKRLVIFRTGIILSHEDGAFKKFKSPLKYGIAPILGNGKQFMSWIHINDLVNLYIRAIENENLSGVYNAVAPQPVSNLKMVLSLAKLNKRKYFIPIHVPSFILKLMLGEMSNEILKNRNVSSQKITDTGFEFEFSSIYPALKNLLRW